MQVLSILLASIFFAYVSYSIWSISSLFTQNLKCLPNNLPCYKYFLRPDLKLAIFSSSSQNPLANKVLTVFKSTSNFEHNGKFQSTFNISLPSETRNNGTLYLHIALAPQDAELNWFSLRRDAAVYTASISEFIVAPKELLKLLASEKQTARQASADRPSTKTRDSTPSTHIMSKISICLLTDPISVSRQDVPSELVRLIQVNRDNQIMPILKVDFFKTRLSDYVQVTKNLTKHQIEFEINPISIGRLRLMLIIEHAVQMMKRVGFSQKDVDEIKGLFSDANLYLLCGTFAISSLHILFDFLSFKSDISFWMKRKSYEGISTRTTLWRAFSQIIIILFLIEENASLLILIPTAIAACIEIWKCKRILKIRLHFTKRNDKIKSHAVNVDEQITEEFDKQGMKYLTYTLYPLMIAGSIYALIYQPHRSWYAWSLSSLVNGVYAFGFLFMLPQLYVNYKLKSVAALPWKAFMYKAFNTFIDDFFAFIIVMPTAHRVACLRDDVVFFVYLYQRWLYPVDKKRQADGAALTYEETDKYKNTAKKNQ